MNSRTRIGLAAALTLTSCVLMTSCAEPPSPESPTPTVSSPAAQPFQGCLLSHAAAGSGSLDQLAAEGLTKTQQAKGITANQAELNAEPDYPRQIQTMVASGCDLVITSGEQAADAVAAAARANPEVKFALLDASPLNPPANLKAVMFNVHEAAFQAGYLAAGSTKSGKVGVFAGMFVPATTGYLDGFAQGVDYFNQKHSAAVELVGWDRNAKNGQVIRAAQPFDDPAAGQQIAEQLIGQGVDVIMPVAGNSGRGALQAAQAHPNVKIIWTETDGCLSQADGCSAMLGSVVKAADRAVENVIEQAGGDKWSAGIFNANLRNDGVALKTAAQAQIEPAMTAALDEIKRGIINGTIQVRSDSAIG